MADQTELSSAFALLLFKEQPCSMALGARHRWLYKKTNTDKHIYIFGDIADILVNTISQMRWN